MPVALFRSIKLLIFRAISFLYLFLYQKAMGLQRIIRKVSLQRFNLAVKHPISQQKFYPVI